MPYTIGLDARKIQEYGIGTYIRNLVRGLAQIDPENRYLLIARPQDKDAFVDLPDNFRPVFEKAPVYSARELVGALLAASGAGSSTSTTRPTTCCRPGSARRSW